MSPHRSNKHPVQDKTKPADSGIGEIFRDYGEKYIKAYKPPLDHIKFVRAVRVCKTPALGGKMLVCKKCRHPHYIYFSCGHSRCPLCQAIKREQWLDKLQNLLIKVPYVHLVTTLPHQLNRLARKNPKIVYNLIFKATKTTIWKIMKDPVFVGATPGMVSVLHSWGSDLKQHIHVHSLLTFGGMDNQGNWITPKHKSRICKNSKLRHTFKITFLQLLKHVFDKGLIQYHLKYDETVVDLIHKQWSVFITKPTMNAQTIENYLARYINRIAVSSSRVSYIKNLKKVNLVYNDYRQQVDNDKVPKKTKGFDPLSFIHQLLSHVPPPYFQRTRRYGLHASAKSKATIKLIEDKARNHPRAIRTTMEIISHLMKLKPLVCDQCGADDFESILLKADKDWIFQFIISPKMRSP